MASELEQACLAARAAVSLGPPAATAHARRGRSARRGPSTGGA